MNIKNTKKLPYYIIFLSIVFCLVLGIWWLYLLSKFANLLQTYVPNPAEINSLYNMIIAEGSTFIILLNIVLISVFVLLRKEHKKFTSLQKFYAIFSHELKTPLTTLQLQLEVLPEILKKDSLEKERIDTILKRMSDSSTQLKYEVEKILTLSQLELAPHFPLEKIHISKFLIQWREKQNNYKDRLHINIDQKILDLVSANYNLLETVFNNLFRNSIKHSMQDSLIKIDLKNESNTLKVYYSDQGEVSNLEKQKLGTLFYKSQQSNGSGLGLFIIKQMMQLMSGKVLFETSDNHLTVILHFSLDN